MARRAVLGVSVTLVLAHGLGQAAEPRPDGVLVHYISAVDGSRQEYGLYIPRAQPPSSAGYPLVMFSHGYGWSVGAGLGVWERDWADSHGWLLVNCNGRGPNFYDGIGDDDVLRVIEDVAQRVSLDRDRVYMTGGSMGGTGAFRVGVRRPDVFAAVAPVDGWCDYREFHWHWYARTDMRDDIEEFRRPYLEATSATFVAQSALWANVLNITDALDDVVYPRNGLGLDEALASLRQAYPEGYESELVFSLDKGHGGGWDIQRIFQYFLTRRRLAVPWAAAVQSNILRYGRVHWAEIEAFDVYGAVGSLYAAIQGDAVYVAPANLTRFALHLLASPAATLPAVRVFVAGQQCYDGPPALVEFEGLRDDTGGIAAWRSVPAAADPQLRPQPDDDALRPPPKRAGLEGPIGEAFLGPFLVVYGTAGRGAAQNRVEAEDFAREWNDFNVHYEAVHAVPEDEVHPEDIARDHLIVFGTLESSALLRRADDTFALPIKVHDDGVTVVDPVTGDRRYAGAQFGACVVYPNPLSDFRTDLVICHGRYRTEPDGNTWRGLGFDLEKLQWGWGDYTVFNNDWAELPRVGNVNNKPPVTCYEAGYFVEAGTFDQEWRLRRSLEVDRVRALRPERSRLVHVAEARLTDEEAQVLVLDEGGGPVRQARVTVLWDEPAEAHSTPTGDDGWAHLPAPWARQGIRPPASPPPSFRVLNVMATGATYDWQTDATAADVTGHAGSLRARPSRAEVAASVGGSAAVAFVVANPTDRPLEVEAEVLSAAGTVTPVRQVLSLAASGEATFPFVWDAGGQAAGAYRVEAVFRERGNPANGTRAAARVVVRPAFGSPSGSPVEPPYPVRLTGAGAKDIWYGEPYEVWAEVENLSPAEGLQVTVGATLVEEHRYLPTQVAYVAPGAKARVTWVADPRTTPLATGVYQVRAFLPDCPTTTAGADFVVR